MDVCRDEWRLIIDSPKTGSENMAVDEALMYSVKNGESPPTIRFYSWNPPCVSIGYFQKLDQEVDSVVCDKLGYDIVRRPTGGRAVLHNHELTYSVIVGEDHPMIPNEITKAYKILSQGLLNGVKLLGLHASLTEQAINSSKTGSAACFDAPSWYELVVEGKKIIGSAQVRKEGILLQHGSIPMTFNSKSLLQVLNFSSQDTRNRTEKILSKKAGGIQELAPEELKDSLTMDNITSSLITGFEQALNITLAEKTLSDVEKMQIEQLIDNKYGSDNWNYKR